MWNRFSRRKLPTFNSAPFARLLRWRAVAPVFVVLLYCGVVFWAKWTDPFSRRWFTLKAKDHFSINCVAVLPKQIRQFPVIIYAHDSGCNLTEDASDLRQMTEPGVADVSLDYNQTNEAAFGDEFKTVLQNVACQKWANTNAVAWVGSGMGADRMWHFALQHPEQQPQLLVLLGGAGLQNDDTNNLLKLVHCPVLLIHGVKDEIFPQEDTIRLAAILQSNRVPVELTVIPGTLHNMEPNRKVVFRCIGEYCLTHLSGTDPWQNYHSIAEWEAEAPSFWPFCIPAVAWALGCLARSRYRHSLSNGKLKQKRHEIALRCVAVVLATWALSETALHLITPHFAVTDRTLAIARRYLVPPKERSDFEFLVTEPVWRDVKLKTLLTHAELANYNRELVNWQVDEAKYQNYVLSPVITGQPDEQLNWRRPLWEEFYPRIRHENSLRDAAVIVVRHLRERVTIAAIANPPREVPTIWLRQITDEIGFQIIYVAALRSVGVPARLNQHHQAEIFDGVEWEIAPAPAVISL